MAAKAQRKVRKQFRLTLGQAHWLRLQARVRGVSESKLLREVLDQYLFR